MDFFGAKESPNSAAYISDQAESISASVTHNMFLNTRKTAQLRHHPGGGALGSRKIFITRAVAAFAETRLPEGPVDFYSGYSPIYRA